MTSFTVPPKDRKSAVRRTSRQKMLPPPAAPSNLGTRNARLPFPGMTADLRTPWRIGPVEVPSRLVLAPMAGVSVQAFRRQGRRFGAGLVCSEMVSCAGLQHQNERTLGYLLISADE